MSMSATLRQIFERGSGLLFDRYFGLIAFAQIYLMVLAGLVLLWRDRAPLSRDVTIVAACYLIPVLLPITNVHGWTGGWSPAARFLLPVAPLLWIGVYYFAAQASATGRMLITRGRSCALRIFARSNPSAPAPAYFSAANLRRSSNK